LRRRQEEINRCAEFRAKRDEVQQLIDDGWHYHDIAEKYGVSHVTVYKEFPVNYADSFKRRPRKRGIMATPNLLTKRW